MWQALVLAWAWPLAVEGISYADIAQDLLLCNSKYNGNYKATVYNTDIPCWEKALLIPRGCNVTLTGAPLESHSLVTLQPCQSSNTGFAVVKGQLNIEKLRITDFIDYSGLHGGGAIYVYLGHFHAHNCEFNSNTANGRLVKDGFNGGAIYNRQGRLQISSSKFLQNSFSGDRGSHTNNKGGAIYNDQGEAVIDDCYFNYNFAGTGGAIYHQYGTMTIINTQFLSNRATLSSGAGGGAVTISGGSLNLTNTIMYSNQATSNGGAVAFLNDNATLIIQNSTFADNRAGSTPDSPGGQAATGGAIAVNGYQKVIISQSMFDNNLAYYGTDLSVTQGTVLVDCDATGISEDDFGQYDISISTADDNNWDLRYGEPCADSDGGPFEYLQGAPLVATPPEPAGEFVWNAITGYKNSVNKCQAYCVNPPTPSSANSGTDDSKGLLPQFIAVGAGSAAFAALATALVCYVIVKKCSQNQHTSSMTSTSAPNLEQDDLDPLEWATAEETDEPSRNFTNAQQVYSISGNERTPLVNRQSTYEQFMA